MQTFLPLPDFISTAQILDERTLETQRKEVLIFLNTLHEIEGFDIYVGHQAVEMWRGYEPQLAEYGITLCEEWINRYAVDHIKADIERHMDWATAGNYALTKPHWFGDPDLHLSHQSTLIRKFPAYYKAFFPSTRDDIEYLWPV
jgi:hypothetical protein